MKKNLKLDIFHTVIFIIFFWGIALRSVELISGNFIWGHDHGRDYLMALEMVEDHKIRLIGNEVGSGSAGINGIFHGPGYHYILALSYIFFQGNPYGGMVSMFIFGVVSLILSYLLTKKIFDAKIAVLVLLFTSISPLIVSQSRFIWSSHPITPFIFLALYYLYRIPDNPEIYIPLSLFVSGFTYESQLGVAIPLFIMVIVSILAQYRKYLNMKIFTTSIISVLLAFLPMILFEIRHDFMAVRGLINYIQNGPGGNSFSLISRLSSHLPFYWYNFINTFTFEFGLVPYKFQTFSVLVALPVVIYGLVKKSVTRERNFFISLTLIVFGTWILYIPLNNIVWDYYLTHLRIIYILMFAYGIVRAVNTDILFIRRVLVAVSSIFLVVFLSGTVYRMYISYTGDLYDYGGYHKLLGKRDAVDYIYSDAGGGDFSLFIYVPYIYTYPYDYLLKTYGKNKYGYLPGKDLAGTVYLLIEPDNDQPWRINGWLETVVNGGNTSNITTLKSGITIHKKAF